MKLFELSLLLLGSSQAALASKLQKPLGGIASSAISTPSLPSSSSYDNDDNKNSDDDTPPPYRETLISLHKSLIEIESISYNETNVGHFLADYLSSLGFATELQYLPSSNSSSSSSSSLSNNNHEENQRFNVLAWPTSARDPHSPPQPKVLVTSHIDTVPPYIPYSVSPPGTPLGPESLIAGRGSVDAKGSVAAQIAAVASLLQDGELENPGDVMLLYVVGEERSGDGMQAFSERVNNDNSNNNNNDSNNNDNDGEDLAADTTTTTFKAAIFGEPTENKLVCGHKGVFGCTITARGRAGHSGYPSLGKSATEVLMRGLVAVLDAELGSDADFGNTTVNVGLIEGGAAPNVIAERATAQIATRVAIGPEKGGSGIVAGRLQEVLRGVDDDAFEVGCTEGYGVVRCACDVEGESIACLKYVLLICLCYLLACLSKREPRLGRKMKEIAYGGE